jgi:peptidylprolyl isomerase
MAQAEQGSQVKVHYTATMTDQTPVDSSRERDPMEFTVGNGEIIEGFDEAVKGMQEGETKQVTITSDKAYGERNDEAIMSVPRNKLPEDLTPEEGMQLEASQEDGGKQLLVITEVKDEDIVVDANHPLAGKDLIFDIELLEVK